MSGRHAVMNHGLVDGAVHNGRAVARRLFPIVLVLLLNTIGWWNASIPPGWLLNGTALFVAVAVAIGEIRR